MRFPVGSKVTETKRKPDGTIQTFACDYLGRGDHLAVILFNVPATMGFTTFGIPPGNTRSLGFFWEDRPLSIYRFIDPDGVPLAHRLEAVTDVTISDTDVTFRDLIVDWWILPGAAIVEEDRDELDELVAAGHTPAEDLARIAEATRLVYDEHEIILEELEVLQRSLGL